MTEPKFLTRAKETYKFHRDRVLGDDDWTLTQTAKVLRRSLGSICEDVTIAKAFKKYPDEISKLEYANEALSWIRKKQKEDELSEL